MMLKKRIVLSFFLLLVSFAANAQLKYYDAANFKLLGKVSNETETRYERLPAKLKGATRQPVWELGKNTAGLAIRFSSNSTAIGVEWVLRDDVTMNHMALTGIKGLDLYVLEGDEWVFVNTARPNPTGKENKADIVANMKAKQREFLLNLPLYDGVVDLKIGVETDASIAAPQNDLPRSRKPVVAYGTSILQGGCASRPGMAHTNILSRWLNREVINLGFSGNGQLDYEIAELMASVDASVFVLDFMPNVTVQQVNEKMEKFYQIIRDKHPITPIIFIENPIFPTAAFDTKMLADINRKNEALVDVYKKLDRNDDNLFFIPSSNMIGMDGEATVDGVHFTDLGFMRYATFLYPTLKDILDTDK